VTFMWRRLFLSVAEEQLGSDEGVWLCKCQRAESVAGDSFLAMPPFLGQVRFEPISVYGC
jgi:hypothetical protein